MALPEIFFVYDDTTNDIVSRHLSQEDANNAAVSGTSTALVGGVTQARAADGTDVDAMLVQVGEWRRHATSPFVRQIGDPYPVRTAVRRWHERHEYLGGLLLQDWVHAWYPEWDIRLGQNAIHFLCAGTWMMWRLVERGDLTVQQFLTWLRNSSLGPVDGPRAFVTIASPDDPGSTLTFTIPGSIAHGSDGNGWKITVRNNGAAANSVSLDEDPGVRSIALNVGPLDLTAAADLIGAAPQFDAGDVVVAGDGTDAFPVPANIADPAAEYVLAGGSYRYQADDPETFFEIAAEIPRDSALRTGLISGISLCDPAPPFGRRTIAQMLVPLTLLSPSPFEHTGSPTVAELNRGRWLEGINQ